MTRITNSEHVLMLLRAQLRQIERPARMPKASGTAKVHKSPLERLRDVARSDDASDEDIQRLFVQNLLADAFGEKVVNDPMFQSVVQSVTATILSDDDSRALLDQALKRVLS